MVNELDDELTRMDELEREENPQVQEAVSLNDPLSSLELEPPIILSRGTSIATVVKKLQDKSLGCVLIEDEGKLVGILTERDILMKITGKGLDFTGEVVDAYMTPQPEYLLFEDPVAYALNKMYVGGFRQIPIVDEEHKPVGLVSLIHIIQHIGTYFSEQILNLPPEPQREAFPRPEGG